MRARIFDTLLPVIPLLALLSAMPLATALPVLAISLIGFGTLCAVPHMMRAHAAYYIPAAAFFLWALCSTLWSIDAGESASMWVRIVILCVLGMLSLHAASRIAGYGHRAATIYIAVFGLCIAALASELLPSGGLIVLTYELTGGDYARFMRKTVNRGLCAFTVFIWPVMYLLYLRQQRALAWGLFFIIALSVACMQSLSAQLGLAVGLGVFVLCRVCSRRLSRVMVIVIPCVFFAVPFAVQALLGSPYVTAHKTELNDMGSGRLPIWESLIAQAYTKPLLGWGMDTAANVPMDSRTMQEIGLRQPPLHPHLSPLHVMLELGIIGLALAAFAIAGVLCRIASAPMATPHYALAMACAASYLGTGLSSFGIWQNWWVASAWLAALMWVRFSTLRPPAIAQA